MAEVNLQGEIGRMLHLEELVLQVLAPYRQNTEAAVIAGALVRIARELYRRYPEATRRALLEGMVAFLEERDVDAEQRAAALGLTLPTRGM